MFSLTSKNINKNRQHVKCELYSLWNKYAICSSITSYPTVNVTERFKECKTAVGDCNKAQAKALDVYVDCYSSIKCPEVGLSCLNPDNSNVIGNGIITNSSMFNCSKNIFSRYEMEIL